MNSRVAIITPYFQRRQGILRRTVLSVVNQIDPPKAEMLIVDDGSPVSARDELQGIELPTWLNVRVLRQANAGVASARNAGLDSMATPIAAVAFLDSDDEWRPHHLRKAYGAICGGCHGYVSKYVPHDGDMPKWKFEDIVDRVSSWYGVDGDLFLYRGRLAADIARGRWLGHTSNLVLRADIAAKVRFENGLGIGEDQLYLLDAAESGMRQIGYCQEVSSRCGDGVNIWAKAGWGTDKALSRAAGEVRYLRLLKARCAEEQDAKFVQGRLGRAKRTWVSVALHDLRRGRGGVFDSWRHAFT
jgi:succinoglycan biosynthesis protein ExoW